MYFEFLNLLNKKNKYLKGLIYLSEELEERFEILNLNQVDNITDDIIDRINKFYFQREEILKEIFSINNLLKDIDKEDLQIGEKTAIEEKKYFSPILECLNVKNQLLLRLVKQNESIFSYLERFKSYILKEVYSLSLHRKNMNSYQSKLTLEEKRSVNNMTLKA